MALGQGCQGPITIGLTHNNACYLPPILSGPPLPLLAPTRSGPAPTAVHDRGFDPPRGLADSIFEYSGIATAMTSRRITGETACLRKYKATRSYVAFGVSDVPQGYSTFFPHVSSSKINHYCNLTRVRMCK